MAITNKKLLGNRGEDLACDYLKQNGYTIIKRNFRCPFAEVDIIATDGDTIAFCEVKTRTSDRFGAPQQGVRPKQKQAYINAARFYFAGKDPNANVRFDIIEVDDDGINHIERAFTPTVALF